MKSNKVFTFLVVLLLVASSLLLVSPSVAFGSKPSVPDFTVAYIDHSYDIPPTYGKDPYTGQTIVTSYGSHVDNRTLDVTIQNQPFTPYNDSSGHIVQLNYNVRSKGHFDDWNSGSSLHSIIGVQASSSSSTVISFNIQYWNVQVGGQIDFQVDAVAGYTYYNSQVCGTQYSTTVDESGWSNTQTITIGNATPASPTLPPYASDLTPTPTPYVSPPNPTPTTPPTQNPTNVPTQNPTATPTQPNTLTNVIFGSNWEQTALIIMAVVIAVLAVALIVVIWRRMAIR